VQNLRDCQQSDDVSVDSNFAHIAKADWPSVGRNLGTQTNEISDPVNESSSITAIREAAANLRDRIDSGCDKH
jgi:hypothetical protein